MNLIIKRWWCIYCTTSNIYQVPNLRLLTKLKTSNETERIACIGWKPYNNKLTSSDLKEESAGHQDLHI